MTEGGEAILERVKMTSLRKCHLSRDLNEMRRESLPFPGRGPSRDRGGRHVPVKWEKQQSVSRDGSRAQVEGSLRHSGCIVCISNAELLKKIELGVGKYAFSTKHVLGY